MENLAKLKMMDVKAQKRFLQVCPLSKNEELTALYYDKKNKTFVVFYRYDGAENYFSTALNNDDLKRLFVLGVVSQLERHIKAIRKIIQKNGIDYIDIIPKLNTNKTGFVYLKIGDKSYNLHS